MKYWERPTQPVVPAVKSQIKQKSMQKTTFQDRLTKDQSHSPPTAKIGSG